LAVILAHNPHILHKVLRQIGRWLMILFYTMFSVKRKAQHLAHVHSPG